MNIYICQDNNEYWVVKLIKHCVTRVTDDNIYDC